MRIRHVTSVALTLLAVIFLAFSISEADSLFTLAATPTPGRFFHPAQG